MHSLTSEQREDLLVKLLNDRGGVELAQSLLQRNGDNSISESPPAANHFPRQPPLQATQTGADAANVDRWIIQLNVYAAEILPVSPPQIYFMTYA